MEQKKENKKCPMCSTKLKLINGKMSCKNCGYYTRDPQAQDVDSMYSNTISQSGGAYQYGASQASVPQKNSKAIIAIVASISAVVCFILVSLLINLFAHTDDTPNRNTQADNSSGSQQDNVQGNNSSGSWRDNLFSQESTPSPTAEPSLSVRLPQSAFFIQLAEIIWKKGFRTITAQEYASLTALTISRDEKTISYQLNYGDTQYLFFQPYNDMKLSDLASFPGLEYLSIDDDLSKGDLDGLNNLYAVFTENSIDEYRTIIPHPEYILQLGIEDSTFKKSLDGLEAFPNLQYLSVDYERLEDISILTQFPNLHGLILKDCDNVTDYSPFMSLPNLEVLAIESSQLKTIDFIKSMPNLTHLLVEDSQITSLDALASCPGLVTLSLTDNYSIKDDDYSIVGELELLQNLTICLGHNFNLPSFEKLTQLQQLTLKNAEDPAPLKDATNVIYLTLEDISWWDLEVLTNMEMLTTLFLQDSHLNTLEPLTRLPNLVTLDLEDTNVYSNIEEIFGIPNLYYLNLTECQVGIDFDNIPSNEMLQVLYLDDIFIREDPSFTSQNRAKVDLTSHYDLFDHFPNLVELYMASTNIDSIAFVEKLPYLQYLDITNNNVTSLKPLEALPNFHAVWCGKNSILENISEDSKILVYTSH